MWRFISTIGWFILGIVILTSDKDPSKLMYGVLWVTYLVTNLIENIREYLDEKHRKIGNSSSLIDK